MGEKHTVSKCFPCLDLKKCESVFEIGGVKLVGRPRQLPTVMIGIISYHGDQIPEDEKEGAFDRKKCMTPIQHVSFETI